MTCKNLTSGSEEDIDHMFFRLVAILAKFGMKFIIGLDWFQLM